MEEGWLARSLAEGHSAHQRPGQGHRGRVLCDDGRVFIIDLDGPEGSPHWLTPKCPNCGERGDDSECLLPGTGLPGADRRAYLRRNDAGSRAPGVGDLGQERED